MQRAEDAIADKNPDLRPDERAAVARIVGIGAVKYADLSTDRIKDYVFDWERMLSFDGDTAPYLQYAHARICSSSGGQGSIGRRFGRSRLCSASRRSGRWPFDCSASTPPWRTPSSATARTA